MAFPEDKDRVISAEFLRALVTKSITKLRDHRGSVRIANAIINEPIELKGQEVIDGVCLVGCHFTEKVDFSGSYFHKDLVLSFNTFKAVNFSRMKTDGAVFFRRTTFEELADFRFMEIGLNLEAQEVQFTSKNQKVSFYGIQVGKTANFSNALFLGPVEFTYANIKECFELPNAWFMKEARFGGIEVKSRVCFQNAFFDGAMDFLKAKIGGDLIASKSKFNKSEHQVSFRNIQIGGFAHFIDVIFKGPADFGAMIVVKGLSFRNAVFENRMSMSLTKIGGQLIVNGAQFMGEYPIEFNGIQVELGAGFDNTVFKGPVSFANSKIKYILQGNDIRFEGVDHLVNFFNIEVATHLVMKRALFMGPVSFKRATIGGNFEVSEAHFKDLEKGAMFQGTKVGQSVYFRDKVTFCGPVDFGHMEIKGNMEMPQAQFKRQAKFNDIKVGRLFLLDGGIFEGHASFNYSEIGANFAANHVRFKSPGKSAEFINAKIGINFLLNNAECAGSVYFTQTEVLGNFEARGIRFIDLKADDSLEMDSSSFIAVLGMNDLRVGRHLYLDGEARLKEVLLRRAHIGGQLSFSNSIVTGKLDMNAIHIVGGFFLQNAWLFDEVNLVKGVIEGPIELRDTTFGDRLDLNGTHVYGSFFMLNIVALKKVILTSADVDDQVAIIGCDFRDELNLQGIKVGGLLIRDSAIVDKVDIARSFIERSFHISNTKFVSELSMPELHVGLSLFIDNESNLRDVNLSGAHIGGQLVIRTSTFSDKLTMQSVDVVNSLVFDNAKLLEVDLLNAKIGNSISISGSEFSGEVDMYGIKVGSALFIQEEAKFAKKVDIVFARIGQIHIANSSLATLDLTGTHVDKEFTLGTPKEGLVTWNPGSTLRLNNTHVGALCDQEDCWPSMIDLNGFIYSDVRGYPDTGAKSLVERDLNTLKGWLHKQDKYSPQPYSQLASVLRSAGYKRKSNHILYAAKEREREDSSFPRRLGLEVLKWSIGYGIGIGYFISLIWVILFVRLGVGFLRWSGYDKNHGIPLGHWYSLDMLLPIIRLRERHYEIDLRQPARGYFYIHKIIGYLLAFVIVAGLSGLIK